MARNYAQIMTSVWRNAEFRALSEAEQRGYLMLVTQPDISAAGVLPLRLRRWADMAADSSTQGLMQVLKALEAGRFIIIDWEAEEVLVRSFIRWDGGFNNPKRRPVIIRTAGEADSALIRRHLAVELERCGLPELPGSPPDSPPPGNGSPTDRHTDSLSGSLSKINRQDRSADPFPQVDSLSDSHAASDGVVVTYVSTEEAATHNPQPTTPPASDAAASATITAASIVGVWADAIAETGTTKPQGSMKAQVGREARQLLAEGVDAELLIRAAQSCGSKGFPTLHREVMQLQRNVRPLRFPGTPPPGYNADGSPKRDKNGVWMER